MFYTFSASWKNGRGGEEGAEEQPPPPHDPTHPTAPAFFYSSISTKSSSSLALQSVHVLARRAAQARRDLLPSHDEKSSETLRSGAPLLMRVLSTKEAS
mmetsp:Transcript_32662/g.97536  ORF Transcript_32662/g.97536 Transcript_32662/m.97536 type:complete len:99 (-) Transcript_32662:386-682(-)